MTLNTLNEILIATAKSNYLCNEAFVGDVYDLNSSEHKYGCFVATPMSALRQTTGYITYSYTLYYIDRLTKDESNMDLIQSDALVFLKGLIDYLEGNGKVEISNQYEFTLFKQQFADWCSGAYVNIDFVVQDDGCGSTDDFSVANLETLTATSNGIFYPGVGYDGFDKVLVDIDLTAYATQEWVDDEIDLKLSGYATESWVSSQQFVTQSWISSQSYLSSTDLSSYATQSWVKSQGYLSSVELSGYVTTSELTSELSAYALKSDIPSLSGYATQSWVNSQQFVTQSWISSQSYLSSTDLSSYATQSWVESQGYLSSVELSGYATESWVSSNFLSATALKNYVSDTELYNHLKDYVTKNAFAYMMSSFATQEWVSTHYLSDFTETDPIWEAEKSSYATQSWVSDQGYQPSSEIWTGTSADWASLTAEQQATYKIALITE